MDIIKNELQIKALKLNLNMWKDRTKNGGENTSIKLNNPKLFNLIKGLYANNPFCDLVKNNIIECEECLFLKILQNEYCLDGIFGLWMFSDHIHQKYYAFIIYRKIKNFNKFQNV